MYCYENPPFFRPVKRGKRGITLTTSPSRFWASVFLGVSLSILLHVGLTVLAVEWSEYLTQKQKLYKRPILVEWVDANPTDKLKSIQPENQIVRKTKLPLEALQPDRENDRRRFLSEDRQTVLTETRAARTGISENRSGQTSEPQAAKHTPAEPIDKLTSQEHAELKIAHTKEVSQLAKERKNEASRELLLPSDPRRIPGVSTTGERLPDDVKIGDFTALNTDRFTYYTFYARVEEQIRHRWVRYVKAALYGGGDVTPGQRQFQTNLEIILNRQGEFQRALIYQTSGSKDLDVAPILAFREAHKIPNPPREMVKEDGTIRLLYSFNVDNIPPLIRSATGPNDSRKFE